MSYPSTLLEIKNRAFTNQFAAHVLLWNSQQRYDNILLRKEVPAEKKIVDATELSFLQVLERDPTAGQGWLDSSENDL